VIENHCFNQIWNGRSKLKSIPFVREIERFQMGVGSNPKWLHCNKGRHKIMSTDKIYKDAITKQDKPII
jgi:hypothetical protein